MAGEASGRTPVIDAVMPIVWQWLRDQVLEGVRAAGYGDLNPAHVALARNPALDGSRPSEIAERMQITRQSVHELITHMEHRGYLVREADASNGRARIVRLTDSGRRLEREVRAQARAAEAQIAGLIGEQPWTQLRDALTMLAAEVITGRFQRPFTGHE